MLWFAPFCSFPPSGLKDWDTSSYLPCPVNYCSSLAQHCQADLLGVKALPDSVTINFRKGKSVFPFTSSAVFLHPCMLKGCDPPFCTIPLTCTNTHMQFQNPLWESTAGFPNVGDLECKGCCVPDEWSLKVSHGSCMHFIQFQIQKQPD